MLQRSRNDYDNTEIRNNLNGVQLTNFSCSLLHSLCTNTTTAGTDSQHRDRGYTIQSTFGHWTQPVPFGRYIISHHAAQQLTCFITLRH